MSFLATLAGRALGTVPVLRPRRPSLFEATGPEAELATAPEIADDAVGGWLGEPAVEARRRSAPRAASQPPEQGVGSVPPAPGRRPVAPEARQGARARRDPGAPDGSEPTLAEPEHTWTEPEAARTAPEPGRAASEPPRASRSAPSAAPEPQPGPPPVEALPRTSAASAPAGSPEAAVPPWTPEPAQDEPRRPSAAGEPAAPPALSPVRRPRPEEMAAAPPASIADWAEEGERGYGPGEGAAAASGDTGPAVRVTIGRIEVRSEAPPPAARPRLPRRRDPRLTLEGYLERRSGPGPGERR